MPSANIQELLRRVAKRCASTVQAILAELADDRAMVSTRFLNPRLPAGDARARALRLNPRRP
jgi:hypothetical protein